MFKFYSRNKKALIGAAGVLLIALVTTLVVTPNDNRDPGWLIFLIIASPLIFIGDDSCI